MAARAGGGLKVGTPVEAWSSQLRKGVVELCVLAALKRDEAYGYQIVQLLSSGGLPVSESSVYPILARLEHDAAVTVRKEPSTSGPPRRYYRLTPAGRERLRAMRGAYASLAAAVAGLLGDEGGGR